MQSNIWASLFKKKKEGVIIVIVYKTNTKRKTPLTFLSRKRKNNLQMNWNRPQVHLCILCKPLVLAFKICIISTDWGDAKVQAHASLKRELKKKKRKKIKTHTHGEMSHTVAAFKTQMSFHCPLLLFTIRSNVWETHLSKPYFLINTFVEHLPVQPHKPRELPLWFQVEHRKLPFKKKNPLKVTFVCPVCSGISMWF